VLTTSLLLFLALVLQGPSPVAGLHAGETVRKVAAAPGDPLAEWETRETGRVLDGLTGRPLAGVRVEALLEDGDPTVREETRTARDGSFRIRLRQGASRLERVRLRLPGWTSRVVTASDVWQDNAELLLSPAVGLSLRVLDLPGRPVPGALVRTREICAHDPYATLGRADLLGRLEIPDFPWPGSDPELYVSAPDHGALRLMDSAWLLALAARDGEPPALHLPRRPAVALRLLGRGQGGQALAAIRVASMPSCWYTVWTGSDGGLRLEVLFRDREFSLDRHGVAGDAHLGHGLGLPGRVLSLREGGWTFPPGLWDSPVATLELTPTGAGAETDARPPVQVVHERGWWLRGWGRHELPPGRVTITVGRAFSGWEEETREVELPPTGLPLALPARREPVLALRLPDRPLQFLHLEAGADSITLAGGWPRQDRHPVPGGRAVTVLADFADGELRRGTLPPLTGAAELDLTVPGSVLRRGLEAGDLGTARIVVEVRDDLGRPLAATSSLDAAMVWERRKEPAPRHVFDVPAGMPFLVACRSPGHTPGGFQGRAPAAGEELAAVVTLRALATLEVRGACTRIHAGGRTAAPRDGKACLDVEPGPLLAWIERSGAPDLALELELAPGEERVLELK